MTVDRHGDEPFDPGDTVLSATLVYRIVDARPVESLLWPDRWCIEVVGVCRRAAWDGRFTGNIHELGTYDRGEHPRDRPCSSPTCAGCAVPGAVTPPV